MSAASRQSVGRGETANFDCHLVAFERLFVCSIATTMYIVCPTQLRAESLNSSGANRCSINCHCNWKETGILCNFACL